MDKEEMGASMQNKAGDIVSEDRDISDELNKSRLSTRIDSEEIEEFNRSLLKLDTKAFTAKLAEIAKVSGAPAQETMVSLIEGAANKGIMPKQALNIGDDTMEAIYSQGYNLYNQGKYKDASYIFRLLMLLDYITPKYLLGFAACLHRLKDFKNAANVYLLCGTLDTTNPLPHYHAADCYLQLESPELAIFSLDLSINAAADQPQYSVIKERALLMHQALEKQIAERMQQTSPTQKTDAGER